jgi:hypothetical protein
MEGSTIISTLFGMIFLICLLLYICSIFVEAKFIANKNSINFKKALMFSASAFVSSVFAYIVTLIFFVFWFGTSMVSTNHLKRFTSEVSFFIALILCPILIFGFTLGLLYIFDIKRGKQAIVYSVSATILRVIYLALCFLIYVLFILLIDTIV